LYEFGRYSWWDGERLHDDRWFYVSTPEGVATNARLASVNTQKSVHVSGPIEEVNRAKQQTSF
jgi:hypothetical protein